MATSTQRNELVLNSLYKELASQGARGIGVWDGPNKSELKFYALRGSVVIIQIFADGDGFEVFAPIEKSNSVTKTIDAIRDLGRE